MTSLETPRLSAEQAAPESRALRLVRILLPIVVLAGGIALWELVVRLNNIPPYVLPAPVEVFRTLIADWPVLSQSAASRWRCCSTNRNGWNIRCFPMR